MSETTSPTRRPDRGPNPLSLGRKAKPTLKHRPAVWECMLGTVEAMNADGETRYFDYDWPAALAYAGIDPTDETADLRTFRKTERVRYSNGRHEPRRGQLVLWTTK